MSPATQRGVYAQDWPQIAQAIKDDAGWICVRCQQAHGPAADGQCLSVHHFDGDKCNNEPWNLMALCQRCHLSIQGRVDPEIPLLMDPSDWIRPYIAGYYESGSGMPGPTYDLGEWIEKYPAAWPAWAPKLGGAA